MTDSAFVALRYAVRPQPEAWVLPEGSVPQSIPHDDAAEHLRLLLLAWSDGLGRPVRIARDLAVRWLERFPAVGIDPDACVLDPPPPGASELSSLCLWKPGHAAPTICFEVVSANHPHKDYRDVHERYAAFGTPELVVFDPLLCGPRSLGGPVALQVWRRDVAGAFERVYAGPGPVFSEVLGCWVHGAGRLIAMSDDRAGTRRWSTREERERAEKECAQAEAERAHAEAERAQAEAERAQAEAQRERAARELVAEKLEALEHRMREIEGKGSAGRN